MVEALLTALCRDVQLQPPAPKHIPPPPPFLPQEGVPELRTGLLQSSGLRVG